jgi:hypothetical protein
VRTHRVCAACGECHVVRRRVVRCLVHCRVMSRCRGALPCDVAVSWCCSQRACRRWRSRCAACAVDVSHANPSLTLLFPAAMVPLMRAVVLSTVLQSTWRRDMECYRALRRPPSRMRLGLAPPALEVPMDITVAGDDVAPGYTVDGTATETPVEWVRLCMRPSNFVAFSWPVASSYVVDDSVRFVCTGATTPPVCCCRDHALGVADTTLLRRCRCRSPLLPLLADARRRERAKEGRVQVCRRSDAGRGPQQRVAARATAAAPSQAVGHAGLRGQRRYGESTLAPGCAAAAAHCLRLPPVPACVPGSRLSCAYLCISQWRCLFTFCVSRHRRRRHRRRWLGRARVSILVRLHRALSQGQSRVGVHRAHRRRARASAHAAPRHCVKPQRHRAAKSRAERNGACACVADARSAAHGVPRHERAGSFCDGVAGLVRTARCMQALAVASCTCTGRYRASMRCPAFHRHVTCV